MSGRLSVVADIALGLTAGGSAAEFQQYRTGENVCDRVAFIARMHLMFLAAVASRCATLNERTASAVTVS